MSKIAGHKRSADEFDRKYSKKPRVEAVKQEAGSKHEIPHAENSREAHAQQKAAKAQRRASKPNADSIQRSKKIWERLRLKSHVPKDERDILVKELFEIITGRVKEFVFKHDSVRVIQCALKYANPAQKKQIAEELGGSYRDLAESRYAKFLVAKLVMLGDEVRDLIVQEFYGHVKRLIKHPEAGWIVDDIYRGAATAHQKAILLREWYGPEFVVFKGKTNSEAVVTADLATILDQSPEKRSPIMSHLKELTNQLVQKKTTGFTMLHDALLQYFLNCSPGTPEHNEFLEMLRDDEEGDCVKNMAFTKPGSQIVCLALAYGSAKDRRNLIRCFKTHIKTLAYDANGCHVILAAYEVIDDTVMTSKQIVGEMLSKTSEGEDATQELLLQAQNLTARIPLLYPLSSTPPKWLVTEEETKAVEIVREIRKETSKKDPETRRTELATTLSQPLLDLVASHVANLAQSSFGCQFMTEVLLWSIGKKEDALKAVIAFVSENPEAVGTAAVGRMLKTLTQGGQFQKGSIVLAKPPLKFDNMLYEAITGDDEARVLEWANGPSSFVVLAMLEAPDFEHYKMLEKYLVSKKAELDHSNNPGAEKILAHVEAASTGRSGPKSLPERKKPKSNRAPRTKPEKGV